MEKNNPQLREELKKEKKGGGDGRRNVKERNENSKEELKENHLAFLQKFSN